MYKRIARACIYYQTQKHVYSHRMQKHVYRPLQCTCTSARVNILECSRVLSYVDLSKHNLHCPVDITQCKHKRCPMRPSKHNAPIETQCSHPNGHCTRKHGRCPMAPAPPRSRADRRCADVRRAVLCPRSTHAETRGQKTDKCTLRGCTARRTSETSGRGPDPAACTYRGGPWAMHKQGPVSYRAPT